VGDTAGALGDAVTIALSYHRRIAILMKRVAPVLWDYVFIVLPLHDRHTKKIAHIKTPGYMRGYGSTFDVRGAWLCATESVGGHRDVGRYQATPAPIEFAKVPQGYALCRLCKKRLFEFAQYFEEEL